MDISPAQQQVNAARQKAARTDRIAQLRGNLNDLETRLYNAEKNPGDAVRSAMIPGLRSRLELARGELDAAIRRDVELTNGIDPKPQAQIDAELAGIAAREHQRNESKRTPQNAHLYGPRGEWPPAAAIEAGAVATEKRGRGRPPGSRNKVQA
jgi:hypothetical protein